MSYKLGILDQCTIFPGTSVFYAFEKIIVEDLLEEDKEVVRNLLVKSYAQYESEYENPAAWQSYLKDINYSIDNPNVDKILVAKNDSTIVGSMQLFQSAEKAYGRSDLQISSPIIRLLAVHPEARGLGVAQQLLKSGINYAKALHASSIYLHTSDSMQKAIQLYEWIGFKRDKTKEFIKSDMLIKCYRLDLEGGNSHDTN